MGTVHASRRAVQAAAAGGGLALLGGALWGLLRAEAALARWTIGDAVEVPPDPSGLYGGLRPGPPLRLAVLGDSAAAGYGARHAQDTFGGILATELAGRIRRPVRLHAFAVVGAQTTDLGSQVDRALARTPDVVVIVIGTNDVTHAVRRATSARALKAAVSRLRAGGAPDSLRPGGPAVVVGTCPDLGTIRPIAPPLRQAARQLSRRLATAQATATAAAGGYAVPLGALLGREFAAAPAVMFGPDRFHPSPAGYRSCALAMIPTVLEALGLPAEFAP